MQPQTEKKETDFSRFKHFNTTSEAESLIIVCVISKLCSKTICSVQTVPERLDASSNA